MPLPPNEKDILCFFLDHGYFKPSTEEHLQGVTFFGLAETLRYRVQKRR
jgi:hypothetical protein